MAAFKTYFPIKGVRTDVSIRAIEDRCFSIELETTDAFNEDTDPKNETLSSVNEPSLIVQKTITGGWVILNEGSFDLNHDDLQSLGRAIEKNFKQAL